MLLHCDSIPHTVHHPAPAAANTQRNTLWVAENSQQKTFTDAEFAQKHSARLFQSFFKYIFMTKF